MAEPSVVRHRMLQDTPWPTEASPLRRETWSGIAQAYATYTSPLRPSQDDLEIVQRAVNEWRIERPDHPMSVISLGVTPDIAALHWPSGSKLLALDSSMTVIRALWPGNIRPRRWAACGNWLSIPCRQRSCDIVVGDGSLNAFRYPHGIRAALTAIRDVLAEHGTLIIRCYVRADQAETGEEVLNDLLGNRIRDINHFKFRLFVALQRSAETGSPVSDIYRFLRERISRDVLLSMPGWSQDAVNGIELWRDADTVYTFPTLAEFRAVFGELFCERSAEFPSYTLGENCPTLLLTARD